MPWRQPGKYVENYLKIKNIKQTFDISFSFLNRRGVWGLYKV